jgi:uncharacterized membrane protein
VNIRGNRTLGGVGAALTVVGAVSSVLSIFGYSTPTTLVNLGLLGVSALVGIIGFLGFILFLVSMYGFSRDYNDHRIFNFIIYGILFTIVAAAVVVVILLAFVFANLGNIIPSLSPNPSSSDINSALTPYFAPFTGIIGFVGLINIIFTVRAFNLIAQKTVVSMFKTGAKVLLAGGILTVVLGIVFAAFALSGLTTFDNFALIAIPGALIQYVAWALLAIAFFRIQAPPAQTFTPSTSYTPPVTQGQVKYCTHCGAQNQVDSTYCVRCGQKLET